MGEIANYLGSRGDDKRKSPRLVILGVMSYIAKTRKSPDYEFVKEIDEFMAAQKELAGVLDIQDYQEARTKGEWEVEYPILVNGELHDQSLMLVVHPHAKPVIWSLLLIWPPAVSRLDFDVNSVHPNPPAVRGETHATYVEGPHIHSWGLNKRFMTSRKTTEPLPIAEALPSICTFNACLRWFCNENNILLPNDHRIHLLDKPELF